MRRKTVLLLGIIFFGGFGALPAHKIHVFADRQGEAVKGYAYFQNGDRASGVTVTLYAENGQKIAEKKTGGQGDFSFTAGQSSPVRVVVSTVDGHRGEYSLAGPEKKKRAAPEREPADLPREFPGFPEQRLKEIVREEMRPFREELAEYRSEIRFSDILAGIGFILGVFGLLMYFTSRSRK